MNIIKKRKMMSGFTLVELLIVMLIIAILALGALPALIKFVNKAKYTASGIPAIANMRVQIQLHETQYGCLPGIGLDADSKPYDYCSISGPNAGEAIQTMSPFSAADEGDSRVPTYMSNAGVMYATPSQYTAGDYLNYHIFNRLDIDFGDLNGAQSKPHHFQYVVPFCKGNDHCYIISCTGDGGGLPVGTAYAVLDFYHSATKTKFMAIYEKYRDFGVTEQMYLHPSSGIKDVSASAPANWGTATWDWKECQGIFVPSLDGIFGTIASHGSKNAAGVVTYATHTSPSTAYAAQVTLIDGLKTDLLKAGWVIQ